MKGGKFLHGMTRLGLARNVPVCQGFASPGVPGFGVARVLLIQERRNNLYDRARDGEAGHGTAAR